MSDYTCLKIFIDQLFNSLFLEMRITIWLYIEWSRAQFQMYGMIKVLIGGKAVGSWKSPSYFHESGVITEEIDDWLSEFLCSSVCTCDW